MLAEMVAGNVKDVMRSHKTGVADVYMVRLEAIRIREGFNAARNADPEHEMQVRELADSMKANGFYRHKPLVVFASADGFLYPSDGHSRYEAVLLANSEGAGIESVPVINEMKGMTEDDRIVGLITNNNGKRLTPLGEAMVIKQLFGRGMDEKEIARRLGFKVRKVSDLLALVAAPSTIVSMVAQGEVSATEAVKALKKKDAVVTLQDGLKKAKAEGKTKVTAQHMKAAPGVTDTIRLDWLADVSARIDQGNGLFEILDVADNSLGKGDTIRKAIDNAMKAFREASYAA